MNSTQRHEIEEEMKKLLCICKRRGYFSDGKDHVDKCTEFHKSDKFRSMVNVMVNIVDDNEKILRSYEPLANPAVIYCPYSFLHRMSPEGNNDITINVKKEDGFPNYEGIDSVLEELLITATGGIRYGGHDFEHGGRDSIAGTLLHGKPKVLNWTKEESKILTYDGKVSADYCILFPSESRARAFMRLVIVLICLFQIIYYSGRSDGESILRSVTLGKKLPSVLDEDKDKTVKEYNKSAVALYRATASAHYDEIEHREIEKDDEDTEEE